MYYWDRIFDVYHKWEFSFGKHFEITILYDYSVRIMLYLLKSELVTSRNYQENKAYLN